MADDKLYLQFAIKKDGDNGANDVIRATEKLRKRIHDQYPIKLKFTVDKSFNELDSVIKKVKGLKQIADKGINLKVKNQTTKGGKTSKINANNIVDVNFDEDEFLQSQINHLNKIPAKYATAIKSIQKYRKEWSALAKDTKQAMSNIMANKSNYINGDATGLTKDLTSQAKARYDNFDKLFNEQKMLYQKAEAVSTTLGKGYKAYINTVGETGHILNKQQYEQFISNMFGEIKTLTKNPNKYIGSIGFDLFADLGNDAAKAMQIFDMVATHQKNLSNAFAPVDNINKADAAYKKLSNTIKDYISVNNEALTKVGVKGDFQNLLHQVDAKSIKNIAEAQRKFEELKVDNKQRQQAFNLDQKNIGTLNKLPSQYETASKAIQKYRQEYKMLVKTYEMDSSRLLRNENMYVKGSVTGNVGDLNAGGLKQYSDIQNNIKTMQTAYMKQEDLFAKLTRIQQAREKALNGKSSFTGIADIDRFKNALKNNFGEQEGTNIFESLTKDAKGLNNELSRLNTNKNKLETFTREFKRLRGDDIKFGSLSGTMNDYIQDYQKALKSAKLLNQATDLQSRVNKRDFPDFKTAAAEVENFKMQARLAGVESDKFLGKFDKTLGSRIRSSMAGMSVFYAQDAFRQMFENLKQVDSAMTELKKVTDETSDTYDKFLSNASDRAQQIGASLVETIQSTSDYARLGYNLNDATKLADSALVYRNVGDDIKSMEDASASLISTMQGFHIEAQDSMSIVDKFNEVSNSFATSSGDIGEGIKRSAAAMYAAGNDLDQTIGLFTGAQTIVQDKLLSPYVVICR